MAQIFQRSTNTIARVSIYGAVIFIALLDTPWTLSIKRPNVTEVNTARPQPVHSATNTTWGNLVWIAGMPFVRGSVFLGRMPAKETCMTCHSQIWTNSSMLEPVRGEL